MGIKTGNVVLPYSLILIFITFFILLFTNGKYFFNQIVECFKYTPLKYLLYFTIYCTFSAFITLNVDVAICSSLRLFRDICLFVIPISLFPILIFPKFINFEKIFRFLFICFISLVLIGIFDYIIQCICPDLHILFRHLTNANVTGQYDTVWVRAVSFFGEPSLFASFLFIFLPLPYFLMKKSIKLSKNPKKNLLFKRSIIIITWIALLLTKSPIYILVSILYTLIYFNIKILVFIKKHIILLMVSLLLLVPLLTGQFFKGNSISEKVFYRTINIVKCVNNVSDLINAEISFGTRVSTVINTVDAWTNYPILGTGYANGKDVMYNQILNSKVPVTPEMMNTITEHGGMTIPDIFFMLLLWTGIIGIFLFYLYLIYSVILIFKIRKYYDDRFADYLTIIGLVGINFIINSFYWSLITDTIMWFIFGLICSIILKTKHQLVIYKRRFISNQLKNNIS